MTRGSNFEGQACQVISVRCSAPNPTSAVAGHPPPRKCCDGSSTMTAAGAISSRWPTKTFGHLGRLGHLGRHGKTSRFMLAAASGAASLDRVTLTSPPQVVSLLHTSGARPANSPMGVAGSFDFVVAVQRTAFPTRKRASPVDPCLRPRLIFLPLVAIACTTRTATLRV